MEVKFKFKKNARYYFSHGEIVIGDIMRLYTGNTSKDYKISKFESVSFNNGVGTKIYGYRIDIDPKKEVYLCMASDIQGLLKRKVISLLKNKYYEFKNI